MAQKITDTITCFCGYSRTVSEIFPKDLFPESYLRLNNKKPERDENGSFEVSLAERKAQKMHADISVLSSSIEQTDSQGEPFESIPIDTEKFVFLCICPKCGAVFGRAQRSKIIVSSVSEN